MQSHLVCATVCPVASLTIRGHRIAILHHREPALTAALACEKARYQIAAQPSPLALFPTRDMLQRGFPSLTSLLPPQFDHWGTGVGPGWKRLSIRASMFGGGCVEGAWRFKCWGRQGVCRPEVKRQQALQRSLRECEVERGYKLFLSQFGQCFAPRTEISVMLFGSGRGYIGKTQQ